MLHKHYYVPHVILEVEMNTIRICVVLFVRFCFLNRMKDIQIVQEKSMHDKSSKKTRIIRVLQSEINTVGPKYFYNLD